VEDAGKRNQTGNGSRQPINELGSEHAGGAGVLPDAHMYPAKCTERETQYPNAEIGVHNIQQVGSLEVEPRTEPPENAREQAQGAQSGFAIQSRENSFRSRRLEAFGSGHSKVQCVRQNCFNKTPEYSCSTESEAEKGRQHGEEICSDCREENGEREDGEHSEKNNQATSAANATGIPGRRKRPMTELIQTQNDESPERPVQAAVPPKNHVHRPQSNGITSSQNGPDETERTSGNERKPAYVVGGPLLCRRPGCGEPARFAFKKARRALVPERCLDHKLPGMVEARHRVCEVVGCSARARFRLPGQKLTSRCSRHKEDGMLHSGMCNFPGCFTRASFRDGPGSKAKRCGEHCGGDGEHREAV
jgi:hypothetical protein